MFVIKRTLTYMDGSNGDGYVSKVTPMARLGTVLVELSGRVGEAKLYSARKAALADMRLVAANGAGKYSLEVVNEGGVCCG